jgi:hypothetical protein
VRLLLIPKIESTDGTGSLTIQPMAFVRTVLERDETAVIDIVVQDGMNTVDWKRNYFPKDWPHLDRLRIVALNIVDKEGVTHARKAGYYIGASVLRYLMPGGKRHFHDAVISNAFPANPMIRAAMKWDWKRAVKRDVPLIAWSVWTATDEWQNQNTSAYDNLAELYGSLASDLLVFESEKVKNDHLVSYRNVFKPKVVEHLMQRTMVASNGVQVDRIPRSLYTGEVAPRALWSGYYHEDGALVLPILFDALRAGRISKLTLNSLHGGFPESVEAEIAANQDVISSVGRMSHSNFLELAQGSDVFLSFTNGPERTYGIRFGEIMAAGVLPVVHTEVAQTFCPKGYEFHTESPGNLRDVFFAALADYREDPRIVEPVVRNIDEHHDVKKNMWSIYEATQRVVDARIAETSFGSYGEYLESAFDGVDEIGHDAACERIAARMRVPQDLTKSPLFPPGAIRWGLLSLGFKDMGGEEPVYCRVK